MKMTINSEENIMGLVLKNKPYKENDMLIWIYTRTYGKMTLIARGVKKLKSKNAPACQTITLGDYLFTPKKGLSLLIKGSSIDYFRHIKEDIELEAYASYFIEYVYRYLPDNDPDSQCFDNLLLALKYLNSGYNPRLVYLLFNAYILKSMGCALEVEQCCVCGNMKDIAGVSISGGGFVCQNCISTYDMHLTLEVLKGFRYINKCNLQNIDLLKLDEEVISQLIKIMNAYIDEFTGLVFKSRKFILELEDFRK